MKRFFLVGLSVVALILPLLLLSSAMFKRSASSIATTRGADDSSPRVKVFQAEQQLLRADSEDLLERRRIVTERTRLTRERISCLEDDLRVAQRQFTLEIDKVIAAPRLKAEQLLNDYTQYLRAEAVFEAQADLSSNTAGYLGAIGAQPLPYPQRDQSYMVTMHNSALQYLQAIEGLKAEVSMSKLTLEREVMRIKDELISLHVDLLETSKGTELELQELERETFRKSLALLKTLGPFLTRELIPDPPARPKTETSDAKELSIGFESLANAGVSADETLAAVMEQKICNPTFRRADNLVGLLKRGAPLCN